MTSAHKTIDHGSLNRLLEAGATIEVEVTGCPGGWGVTIGYGGVRQALAVMRGDARIFRKFETLVHYLEQLGVVAFRVDASAYRTQPRGEETDQRRRQASDRMKRAHAAAALERRFQARIEEAGDSGQEIALSRPVTQSVT